MQQHFVGLFKRLVKRNALTDDREQSLVGHDDHRVHMLAHFGDAFFGLTHALAPLEQKRPRDDADSECTGFARELTDHRRRTGTRPTTHAAGDEHEIGVAKHTLGVFAVLVDGLTPDLGASPGTKSARELLADLYFDVGLGVHERLRVGIHRNELDALEVFLDHAVHGIAATAAYAHDFHAGVLGSAFFELEGHAGELHTGLYGLRVVRTATGQQAGSPRVFRRELRRRWRSVHGRSGMWKIVPHGAKASLEYTFESGAQPVKFVEVGRIRHEVGQRETGAVLSTRGRHSMACDIPEWSH